MVSLVFVIFYSRRPSSSSSPQPFALTRSLILLALKRWTYGHLLRFCRTPSANCTTTSTPICRPVLLRRLRRRRYQESGNSRCTGGALVQTRKVVLALVAVAATAIATRRTTNHLLLRLPLEQQQTPQQVQELKEQVLQRRHPAQV